MVAATRTSSRSFRDKLILIVFPLVRAGAGRLGAYDLTVRRPAIQAEHFR